MEKRVALIGIIVEEPKNVAYLNTILGEHSEFIIGRMGIPYRERNVNVISVVLDAPNDIINSISGKIGKLDGISVKTLYSKL